jgi:hypothetical protein
MAQQHPTKPRPKLFGIGLNKTGTSSLRSALEFFGYRVCGPRRNLLKALRRGDFSAFDEVVAAYDAFEDIPWPLAFDYLFERYGTDTRFVLTTRSSADAWFNSIENHARSSGLASDTWLLTYGTRRPFGRAKEYKELYTHHNERVRAYFRERNAQDRLLEICFDRGEGWPELCRFIAEPVPDIPFPHVNRTDMSRKRLNRILNSLVEPVYRGYVTLTEAREPG